MSVDPAGAAARRAALDAFARLGATPAASRTGAERPAPGIDGAPAAPRATRAELRRLAHALEGVFLNQLFQAMRSSVPRDQGPLTTSSGEEMFTSLMDESLSQQAAQRMSRGVGEALYRQLARGLPPEEGTSR
jgi:hypothetical protein